MNILLTGAFKYTKTQIKTIEKLGYNVTFVKNELKELEIDTSIYDVVVCNALFLYNSIDKFKNLKIIQTTSAGLDRIPLEYTLANNIKVYSAKDVYSVPMSEFAVMQILNIYKNNKFFIENQKNKNWSKNKDMRELSKLKALIMGYGNVGREVSKRLHPFVAKIYAYDNRIIKDDLVEYVRNYDDILKHIDILIITLPLVAETFHLIDKGFLDKLKHGISLINISRGQIINELDLIEFIKKKKFIGVALDVFETEPLNKESQLWGFENVYLTPHNSYISELNNDRLFKVIIENIGRKK